MKALCLGDSLTFGSIGYSYIPFLREDIKAQNEGLNGDTLKGAYDRLQVILEDPQCDADVFIVGIGTNDILLPYLGTVSNFWKWQMKIRTRIKKVITNNHVFYTEFEKLLKLLLNQDKKVILFGLPFINLENYPDDLVRRRNAIIESLAEKYDLPFIDIYKLQKEEIAPDEKLYSWKDSFWLRMADEIMMGAEPESKDTIPIHRGLTTSVDGIHFHSSSAKLLAQEIEKVLGQMKLID